MLGASSQTLVFCDVFENLNIQYFGFCQSVFSRALVLEVSFKNDNQYFHVRWFLPNFQSRPTPVLFHPLVLLSWVLLFACVILINGCVGECWRFWSTNLRFLLCGEGDGAMWDANHKTWNVLPCALALHRCSDIIGVCGCVLCCRWLARASQDLGAIGTAKNKI